MRPITERLSPVIKLLVIVDTLLFSFYALVPQARGFFNDHLALGLALFHGEFWQPATALFVHVDFVSFAFNIIGLWFVGATIERAVGRQRFLILFLVPAVVANLVMAGLAAAGGGTPDRIAGSGLAVLALFVAFGKIFARTPARVMGGLVLQARTLAAIMVGFALLADLARAGQTGPANLVGDVVAVTLAYVLSGGRGAGLRELWLAYRSRQRRRRIQVIEGGRRGGRPGYLN